MRLVPTSSVQVGSKLARDVLVGRPDGIPLLRAGVAISSHYRSRLVRAGINAIYIEDMLGDGINPEPIVSDETREVATRAVATAYRESTESMVTGAPLPDEAVASLGEVVERIIDEIGRSGGATLALADLASADAYTFQHSIDVTALGLLLGQRLWRERGWLDYRGVRRHNRIDERLHLLGLGLLLHDIGKLAIPTEIVQRPGLLSANEWEMMKTHPRLGVDLLHGTHFSPLVKAIVLRHHERWDGSGYPDGKRGTEIHEMARIAAIADVYDAVTSERPYAPARAPHQGVRVILNGAGTQFDPDIVELFSRLVAPFPPGVEVRLADGRRAVVVSVPPDALDRPVVRVIDGPGAPYEISLREDRGFAVAGWEHLPQRSAA
jgi:HD-GYP domain-containing protein (c-di-GMP phosphodiesterase class II)